MSFARMVWHRPAVGAVRDSKTPVFVSTPGARLVRPPFDDAAPFVEQGAPTAVGSPLFPTSTVPLPSDRVLLAGACFATGAALLYHAPASRLRGERFQPRRMGGLACDDRSRTREDRRQDGALVRVTSGIRVARTGAARPGERTIFRLCCDFRAAAIVDGMSGPNLPLPLVGGFFRPLTHLGRIGATGPSDAPTSSSRYRRKASWTRGSVAATRCVRESPAREARWRRWLGLRLDGHRRFPPHIEASVNRQGPFMLDRGRRHGWRVSLPHAGSGRRP